MGASPKREDAKYFRQQPIPPDLRKVNRGEITETRLVDATVSAHAQQKPVELAVETYKFMDTGELKL